MEQKYYLHNGSEQTGPFSVEELKEKNITAKTHVWYEGIKEWVKAESVPELKEILSMNGANTPPPFAPETPPPMAAPKEEKQSKPKKDGYSTFGRILKWTGGIGLLAIGGFMGFAYLQSRTNQSDGTQNPIIEVIVNPPNPRIVTSRSEKAKESSLFDYAQAVDGTVLNEGGEGSVLVTATLTQGEQTFTQKQELYMNANQTNDVHFVFKEANVLNGEMVYNLTAKPIK